jgi:hypothetical protein
MGERCKHSAERRKLDKKHEMFVSEKGEQKREKKEGESRNLSKHTSAANIFLC